MGFLFELIFEFILDILIEVLAELGLHSVGEAFQSREKRNPFLAAPGYLLLGLISGALSLLLFLVSMSKFSGLLVHGITPFP